MEMPPRFFRPGVSVARLAGTPETPNGPKPDFLQLPTGERMNPSRRRILPAFFLALLLLTCSGLRLDAQTAGNGQAGGLNGVVTDPSGGVITKASVRLTDASGASYDATTTREGFYEFKGLAPGTYTLKAVAKGFALFTQEVQIAGGPPKQVNIG